MNLVTTAALCAALAALPATARAIASPGDPTDAYGTSTSTPSAQETYQDITATFGFVPTFLKAFPQDSIAGAWKEMKGMMMQRTAIDPRTKELIGLAVAAQIPCRYCSYYHEAAAKSNGASDEQIREAVAMAALTRHWATFVDGRYPDWMAFRHEADRFVRASDRRTASLPETMRGGAPGALGQGVATGREHDKQPGMEPPMRESPGPSAKEVGPGEVATSDVDADIQRRLGYVPAPLKDFPPSARAGAWEELKSLELNPNTEINAKDKELIAVAVAAQIPSQNEVYLHTQLAKRRGASQEELDEALAVASLTRHWSTMLNGLRLDEAQFQRDTDQMLKRANEQPK